MRVLGLTRFSVAALLNKVPNQIEENCQQVWGYSCGSETDWTECHILSQYHEKLTIGSISLEFQLRKCEHTGPFCSNIHKGYQLIKIFCIHTIYYLTVLLKKKCYDDLYDMWFQSYGYP